MPRRKSRGRVYGGVILVTVILAFILQFQWMQRVRESGATDLVQNSFARKISNWMLRRKGLAPEDTGTEAHQPGVEKITCATCMGTGMQMNPDGKEKICPICQGVGFRMVRRFDAAERQCPACAGMGRVEMPDTGEVETCPRCNGRGLIRRSAPAEDETDGE